MFTVPTPHNNLKNRLQVFAQETLVFPRENRFWNVDSGKLSSESAEVELTGFVLKWRLRKIKVAADASESSRADQDTWGDMDAWSPLPWSMKQGDWQRTGGTRRTEQLLGSPRLEGYCKLRIEQASSGIPVSLSWWD